MRALPPPIRQAACALVMTAMAWPMATLAQAQADMPGAAEIEARMRSGRIQLPSGQETRQAAPTMPDVDALPPVDAGPAVDLSEMAERFERLRPGPDRGTEADGQAGTAKPLSGLLAFVSFGMPTASLEALVADAERCGALLVLRGVKDRSLKATKAWIQQLIGQRRVAWRIDPTLYRSLDVQVVPTYVLIDPSRPMEQPCQAALCGQPAHSRVSGDVTLQHALSAMAGGDPGFDGTARLYLERLRRSAGARP